MNRFIVYIIISIVGISSLFAQEPVLYGERGDLYQSDHETTRIFLDQRGDFYPDISIPDTALSDAGSTLSGYYTGNQAAMDAAKAMYTFSDDETSPKAFRNLQNAIEQEAVRSLNEKLNDNTELYMMVHGFRKPLQAVTTGTNSLEDFNFVKAAIKKNRPGVDLHFIEVYWDGTYIQVKESIGGMVQLGKLFTNQAIPNSTYVGLGLRKFVSEIHHPKIHIIAHSLGAQVVNNILWNADAISGGETPDQEIDVCLVAPAVARKPFRLFYNRSTEYNFKEKDNYKFSIIYNELDIVVAKSNFGDKRYFRFTRFFGNTKLGCNCAREAEKVVRRFRNQHPNSTIELYDATAVGNNHRWGAYSKSAAFESYLDSLDISQ